MAEAQLKAAIAKQREWASAVVFDHDGKVLAGTFDDVSEDECKALTTSMADRDATVGGGLTFRGEAFEVHRVHDAIVIGRRGQPPATEGIAVHRVTRKSTGKDIFAVITYRLPTVSARAVPQLTVITCCSVTFASWRPSV